MATTPNMVVHPAFQHGKDRQLTSHSGKTCLTRQQYSMFEAMTV